MSIELYTIKPIKWQSSKSGDDQTFYAQTPFGFIEAHDDCFLLDDRIMEDTNSLKESKVAAEKWYAIQCARLFDKRDDIVEGVESVMYHLRKSTVRVIPSPKHYQALYETLESCGFSDGRCG